MAAYDGETLRTRIDRGLLPLRDALAIGEQIAQALAAAHERGIVHRDVKPDNVFITSSGVVKLLDFGLARRTDGAMSGSRAVEGTVAYMSPEQARGERADERSDVWALGVILFEMLAGIRPFAAGDPGETIRLILTSQPDLRARRPDLAGGIADVVHRALSKVPARRFVDGGGLLDELRACRSSCGARTVGARRSHRRSVILVATGSAALLMAAAGWWRWSGIALATASPSVAILPFSTGTAAFDELVDRLAEGVRANLAFVPGLDATLVPSTSPSTETADPRSVGRSMRVATVLDGDLELRDDRLLVTARLIDARTGASRWTGTYERTANEVSTLVDELSFAIADSLRLHIAPFEPNAYTDDTRAYDRFLEGVYSQRRYTREDIWAALQFYRESYEEDTAFALAHAVAGNAYIALTNLGLTQEIGFARAREHVDRSLALDSALAEGHAALGFLQIWNDRDFEAGERSLRRAMMLYPTLPQARAWYGWYSILVRDWREAAVASLRRALEVDPLNTARSSDLERVLYLARRYDDVLEQHRATWSLDAEVAASLRRSPLAETYREMGRYDDAIAEFLALRERVGGSFPPGLAITYARMGREMEAREILRDFRRRVEEGNASPFDVARIHASLGELDNAFRWLERAEEQRPYVMIRLMADPTLDPLRSDPRYTELLRRVGLGPP
jgi:serine/threonine-protein kinase